MPKSFGGAHGQRGRRRGCSVKTRVHGKITLLSCVMICIYPLYRQDNIDNVYNCMLDRYDGGGFLSSP